jgi:hypothetical protein
LKRRAGPQTAGQKRMGGGAGQAPGERINHVTNQERS